MPRNNGSICVNSVFVATLWNITNTNEKNQLHSHGLLFELNNKRLAFFYAIAKSIDCNSRVAGSHFLKFRESLFENGMKRKVIKVKTKKKIKTD